MTAVWIVGVEGRVPELEGERTGCLLVTFHQAGSLCLLGFCGEGGTLWGQLRFGWGQGEEGQALGPWGSL